MKTFITIVLFTICLANFAFSQQRHLDKKISISAEQISFQEFINLLSKKAACNFSFNAKLVPLNEPISVYAKDKPLSSVLTSVCDKYSLDFKEINNQIIIFSKLPEERSLAINNMAKPKSRKEKPDTTNYFKFITVLDTITYKVNDTIVVYDTVTIVHIDTLIYRDTIRIVLKEPGKTAGSKNAFPLKLLQFDVGMGQNSFELNNKNLSDSIFSQLKTNLLPRLGIQFNILGTVGYENFFFQSGLGYSFHNFSWNYKQTLKGGYMGKDTVSQYYTVSGIDTSWVYIVRDKFFETLTYSRIKTSFSTHYLNVPFLVGYRLNYKKISIEALTGAQLNFLLLLNGESFMSVENIQVIRAADSKSLFNNFNISSYSALHVKFSFDDSHSFFVGVSYFRNLFSMHRDNNSYSKKLGYMGIKLGFLKKL